MSVPTKDGAWISATTITRFDCTVCGNGFYTTPYPVNERETEDLIREHALWKHGGIDRGYEDVRMDH